MLSPMILNLTQMQNDIMENLFLFHAYMNSRSNKNSINPSILRSRRKLTAPNGAHLHFLIPKKDRTVSFISDFRELEKRILRQPYPIPKIQDLLLRLEGFLSVTILDLNMGYYRMNSRSDKKSIDSSILRL